MAEDDRIHEPATGIGEHRPTEIPAQEFLAPPAGARNLSFSLARWSAAEIVGAFLIGTLCPQLLFQFLRYSGWYTWVYGADFLTVFDEGVRQSNGTSPQVFYTRLMLWAFCAALPLQLLATLALLNAFSGTRLADVGLTPRRMGRNLVAGLLAAVALVPGVYGIQGLVVFFVNQLGGSGQEHPFAKLGEVSLLPSEWVVLILVAVVVAPIWEELLFRGIIQPWVIDRRFGGPSAFLAALAVTVSSRLEYIKAAADLSGLLVQLLPVLILLALVPVYLVLARHSRAGAGLFAASVLFAWVHAGVWPSPIPLFWLALGLGWLALRTRSLVGPIVLHALFNGVACVVLLFSR
jgi:membrane protease YdiL (CAAX protease family)